MAFWDTPSQPSISPPSSGVAGILLVNTARGAVGQQVGSLIGGAISQSGRRYGPVVLRICLRKTRPKTLLVIDEMQSSACRRLRGDTV